MTDPTGPTGPTERDLSDLLALSTDRLPDPHLAAPALRVAGHRRTRRRRVGAAVGASAAVAALAVVLVVSRGGPDPSTPAPVVPVPSGSDTSAPETTDADPDVQEPLVVPLDLPQERSLNLPPDLTAAPPASDDGGGVLLAMQQPGGPVMLVRSTGTRADRDLPPGTLFRHSLALDGGALALRTPDGFSVYSIYADDVRDYVAPTAGSGLWLGDSVAFVYDVAGPGGEFREHEPPYARGAVGFPAGGDPDQVDLHPSGGADEVVDGSTYVRWGDYQDERERIDLRRLGELRGPVSGTERWAAVRTGAAGPDGVLVLDRAGEPQALLPVEGTTPDAIALHHWVDDARLLLQVGDRLVLWHVDDRRVTQVSVLPDGATVSVSDGDGSLVRR